MRRFLRFLRFCLLAVIIVIALAAALFGYYVYTPAPDMPRLTGTLSKGTIAAGGFKRSYVTYVPRGLPKGAPLVVVMHGSGESSAQIRIETGYGFERLADAQRFAVVYPNAHDGYWNVCSIVGNSSDDGHEINDVVFLTALVDKLITDIGVDSYRVFATGSSRGGSMALRLALEAPARFRAVAAVSASVPTPDNFKCKPAGHGTSSVMIMNGTEDPLVPFDGGEVSLLGLAYKNGKVMSSRASGQYFAGLNSIAAPPRTSMTTTAHGIGVEQVQWHTDSSVEVELVAIHGGGHGIPQPYRRRPRILGPASTEPNGPAVIWEFFARQHP